MNDVHVFWWQCDPAGACHAWISSDAAQALAFLAVVVSFALGALVARTLL